MYLKDFLKPTRGKIIALLLIILIVGVPAISSSCQGFVTTPEPPPCIERFEFSNLVIDFLGFNAYPYVLDAVTSFTYNPIIVIGYFIILYIILSGIFSIYHLAKNPSKTATSKS